MIKALLKENSFCVLATCADNIPITSLMQFIWEDSCSKIYMLTLEKSKKALNIQLNPTISLLIDTRENPIEGRINAITIHGTAVLKQDKKIKQKLLNAFPNLIKLTEQGDVILIEIEIEEAFGFESNNISEFYHQLGIDKELLSD